MRNADNIRERAIALLESLAAFLPYVVGVFFIWFPIRRIYFDPFLERASYFLMLFLGWELLLAIVFRWYLPRRAVAPRTSSASRSASTPYQRAAEALLLITMVSAGLGVLLLLQFFRARFSDEQLYLALFTLGTLALRRGLTLREKHGGALLARFGGTMGLGYLSFMIVDPFWKWQPLLPCAGIATLFVARDLAYLLDPRQPPGQDFPPKHYKILSRLLVLCFLLAPTFGTALCYFGKLSGNFIFLFGICPLLLPLAERLRAAEAPESPKPPVLLRSRVIFVAYAAILIGVGLLGRFS